MTTLTQSRTASLLAQMVNAVAGAVVVRARQVAQHIKNRRDAATLAGLDDRMLSDIGLTRGDLRDAYSEPVWSDPTAILVSRAQERRINRRRTWTAPSQKPFEAPTIVPAAHASALDDAVHARYY